MSVAANRRAAARAVLLDRSLESLPLFRLSDSSDDASLNYVPEGGGRWRVFPAPGDRLPGTFDQDVYIEVLRRYHELGTPGNGVVSFTLHNFLRSTGRRVDGRTYEQLRASLARLERTILESEDAYLDAANGTKLRGRFTVFTAVAIERRRLNDRDQFTLFPTLPASEPGDARVTLAPLIRSNIAASHTVSLSAQRYLALASPVARRIYRLLEVAREEGKVTWRVGLDVLAPQLPLVQRYPTHLQRVLQPAHEMLVASGLLRDAAVRQQRREWFVDYVLASRAP